MKKARHYPTHWTGLAFLAGVLVIKAWELLAAPQPYGRVVVMVEDWSADHVHLGASFTKYECDFVRLVAIGHYGPETGLLRWVDPGYPPDFDRGAGRQALTIRVYFNDRPDRIDIRTRHDCDGETVDKLFAALVP